MYLEFSRIYSFFISQDSGKFQWCVSDGNIRLFDMGKGKRTDGVPALR